MARSTAASGREHLGEARADAGIGLVVSTEPAGGAWPLRGALTALTSMAFASAVALSATVFAGFSTDNDEPVYVFQSRLLLDRRLTVPTVADSEFFRPWMSGRVADHLVMVFPPVVPALFALAKLLAGDARVALGVFAAVGVALVYALTKELVADRRTALLAAALMAVCPLFVIQSALFLSYVVALDLELAAAVLLAQAVHRRRAWRFAPAGAVLGLLFFARPFDAVLAGVPLVVTALWAVSRAPVATSVVEVGPPSRRPARPWARAHRTKQGRLPAHQRARLARAWRSALALAAGAVPLAAASFAYNAAVTGSPWRLPLDAIGGDNRPGFGWRRLSTGTPRVHYGFSRALVATGKNLLAVPVWLPGSFLLIALAVLGLYRMRRSPWAWALAAFVVTFPLGYLFYWGNLLVVGGRRSIGPHYYLALLAPLVVLGAVGLRRLAAAHPIGGVVMAVLILAASLASINHRIGVNRSMVALHGRERALLAGAHLRNAIVILPSEPPDGAWLGRPRPLFINDPQLRQPVLFATDHGGENFRLLDDYPTRSLYRQFSRSAPDGSHRPVLWKLTSVSGPTLLVRQHVENPDGSPLVTVDAGDTRGRVRYLIDAQSSAGRSYELTWAVSSQGVTLQGPGTATELSRPPDPTLSTGTLTFGASFGPSDDAIGQARFEVRYWYRARDGRVSVMLPGEGWRRGAAPKARWVDSDLGPTFTATIAAA